MNNYEYNNSRMSWSFFNVFNSAVISKEERKVEPREHGWASELGNSYFDRYLKMTGVAPTNPPNTRSKRKFFMGYVVEDIVRFVLQLSGLVVSTQERMEHQYEGLIKITGKCDIVAGGTPNLLKAKQEVEALRASGLLPDHLYDLSISIIEQFSGMNLSALKNIILEVKSVSDRMFSVYETTNRPAENHRLQAYHYLVSSGYDESHIIYINKDSALMIELPVFKDDKEAEMLYKKDITEMTQYLNNKTVPPKEEEVTFNGQSLSFKSNWRIEYSSYLSMYGFNSPEEFRDKWKKVITSWNRTYRRSVNGDKVTPLNAKVLEDIRLVFPNLDELIEIGKANKEFLVEEETVEE